MTSWLRDQLGPPTPFFTGMHSYKEDEDSPGSTAMDSPDGFPNNNQPSPPYSPRLGALRRALEDDEAQGAFLGLPEDGDSTTEEDPLGTPCRAKKRPWFLEPIDVGRPVTPDTPTRPSKRRRSTPHTTGNRRPEKARKERAHVALTVPRDEEGSLEGTRVHIKLNAGVPVEWLIELTLQ